MSEYQIITKFIKSAPSLKECPELGQGEIAIIGRSNVGKSSFINTAFKKKGLARTSSTPGRTQLINYFEADVTKPGSSSAKKLYVADLPGYGFSKVNKAKRRFWAKELAEYIEKRENLELIVLVVDLRHAPQDKDLEAKEWLEHLEIPYMIIATKADKVKQKDKSKNTKALKEAFGQARDFIVFSAERRTGLKLFWNYLAKDEFI